MISPVALRQQYSDLFGATALPVLEEIFWSEYELHPSRRETLFKVVPHDREIFQYTEMHDLPFFNQVPEGGEYSFTRPLQGANKTLTVLKYGLGVSVSEEMIDDARFALVADMLRKLGRSAQETREVAALSIINNGFPTSLDSYSNASTTTADGATLFSLTHTLPTGLTYRNMLLNQADLSPTSLDQALADMETQTIGDSGIIERIIPKILLVNPALKRYAHEIVGSDLKADTADNNVNPFKEDGLTVVSSPHFTDPDGWVLLTDPDRHGLRIIERTPVQTKAAGPDVGFTTDAILYKSRYREALGAFHGKGVFGSPGV